MVTHVSGVRRALLFVHLRPRQRLVLRSSWLFGRWRIAFGILRLAAYRSLAPKGRLVCDLAEQVLDRHIETVVHVLELDPPVPARRGRPLLVLFESHVVVVDRLSEVPSLVLAGSSCIRRVDVVWVNLEHRGEVVNRLVDLAQLLEGAPSDVESSCVLRVKLHQLVAVLDGLVEPPLFEQRRSPDKQRFLVRRVLLQLLRAHSY